MISFECAVAPSCLEEFAASINPIPSFDELPFADCKQVTRTRLLNNQDFQCVYCESPLTDDGASSHVEHLEPHGEENGNPNRRFDITNLAACCQRDHTCGHRKGQQQLPEELHPYLTSGLHLKFHCDSGGALSAEGLSLEAANFAFDVLKLNDLAFKSLRATVIRGLRQQTIALGANARRRIRRLSSEGVGFKSLYYQELGVHGFPEP